MYWSSSES